MTLSRPISYDELDEIWRAAPRFWARVRRAAPDACWIWTGHTMTAGYGEMTYRGRNIGAHRFSFLLHSGELEAGRCVLHTCDNRRCVNPSHLYQGTYLDNWRDMSRGHEDRTPPPSDFWEFLDE